MKKINSSLRVTELDTLSDIIVRLYKDAAKVEGSAVATDANLSSIMTEVEKLSTEITSAIKKDKISLSLDEKDIVRDEVVRSLGDVLTGYAALPIPGKKESASKLLALYAKYGKQITSKSYAEESSLIESMIDDFSAEALKTDIASLEGLPDLLSSLRGAQDDFNMAYDEAVSANAEKGNSATDVKKTLLSIMNYKFIPYITAVSMLDSYKDFASKCETEINKANANVSSRSKSNVKLDNKAE